MNYLSCFFKKHLLLIIFLISFLIIIGISKSIFSAESNCTDFNAEWRFQDEVIEMILFYSEDHQQGRLEVSLKDNVKVDEYKLNYHLKNQQDKKPQLLISKNAKDFLPKNNFKIMLRQNNKNQIFWFKLKDDISNRAGLYQFDFQSSSGLQKGPIIPFDLRLKKLARIMVGPPSVNIKMNAGPGGYELEKPIQIMVKTNYPEWSLEAIAKPLFYIDEKKVVVNNNKEQSIIPVNRMKLIYNEKEIVMDESAIVIDSVKDQYTKKYFFKLKIYLTWKDQAGHYDSGGLEFKVVD